MSAPNPAAEYADAFEEVRAKYPDIPVEEVEERVRELSEKYA